MKPTRNANAFVIRQDEVGAINEAIKRLREDLDAFVLTLDAETNADKKGFSPNLAVAMVHLDSSRARLTDIWQQIVSDCFDEHDEHND